MGAGGAERGRRGESREADGEGDGYLFLFHKFGVRNIVDDIFTKHGCRED